MVLQGQERSNTQRETLSGREREKEREIETFTTQRQFFFWFSWWSEMTDGTEWLTKLRHHLQQERHTKHWHKECRGEEGRKEQIPDRHTQDHLLHHGQEYGRWSLRSLPSEHTLHHYYETWKRSQEKRKRIVSLTINDDTARHVSSTDEDGVDRRGRRLQNIKSRDLFSPFLPSYEFFSSPAYLITRSLPSLLSCLPTSTCSYIYFSLQNKVARLNISLQE